MNQRHHAPSWKFWIISLTFILIIGGLSSCTTVKPAYRSIDPRTPTGLREDVVHTVGPGETFWRISKMYDVPIGSILAANALDDPTDLKMGQRLLVPNAAPIRPVIHLFPTNKWRYIIVHHSATNEGNALLFHKYHLKRGWDRGVGYHFVIDKKSSGKYDGQIEMTPRWLKQHDGAHTKASKMNEKAIGVVLVGNFNSDRVSDKQMDSLVYLVKELQNAYNIPQSRVLGHRHVRGALTDCPGKNFPWREFLRRIR